MIRVTPNSSSGLKRWLVFALVMVAAWVAMTFTHECGHLVGGWISGATLADCDLVPWRMPYSLHSPDPHPLVTLWAGPILGVAVPVVVAAVFRSSIFWTIASFCLLANGSYLALAWFAGDRWLDTARLLNAGTHPVTVVVYCVLTLGLGYRGFRNRCIEMLDPKSNPIDRSVDPSQSDADSA